MTYTVELDSETDAMIAERATRRGLTVPEYLKRLVEEDVHEDEIPFGERWVTVFGDREPGTGKNRWSEVEAACDPH